MTQVKPKTRMLLILDKSGSMETTKKQAISGLNEQIQEAVQLSKEHDLKCSLLTFNSEVYEHLWDVPAEQLEEADESDFVCNGGTAMRDAMGYGITKLITTAGPDDEETAYLVIVVSDGETNSDRAERYKNVDKFKALIEKCQATGRWTFTYMGCSEDYLRKISAETSIPIANCAAWSNNTEEQTLFAFSENRKKMRQYFCHRTDGHLSSSLYASDDASKCADYTEEIIPGNQIGNQLSISNVLTSNNPFVQMQPSLQNLVQAANQENNKGGWLSKNTECVSW